jgi:hypothetical protein
MGQDRALANARAAATDLSRRRVEREEVAFFLEQRGAPAIEKLEPTGRHANEVRPR